MDIKRGLFLIFYVGGALKVCSKKIFSYEQEKQKCIKQQLDLTRLPQHIEHYHGWKWALATGKGLIIKLMV